MASIPTVPADTSVDKLLTEIMPKVSQEMLSGSNAPTELAGTEISMVVEVGGDAYSYILKDGSEVTFSKADTNNAKLRLKVSKDDMEKMKREQAQSSVC